MEQRARLRHQVHRPANMLFRRSRCHSEARGISSPLRPILDSQRFCARPFILQTVRGVVTHPVPNDRKSRHTAFGCQLPSSPLLSPTGRVPATGCPLGRAVGGEGFQVRS
jgi:hypothetical protein